MFEWFKEFLISILFKFTKKDEEYDLGRVRALVKFTNGKTTDLTVIGRISVRKEAINRDGTYPLEYKVVRALDIFHELLENIDDNIVDFIAGDNRIYYRLDQNKVDEIQIMDTGPHMITKTVYDKVRK